MQAVPTVVRNFEIGGHMTLDLSSPRIGALRLEPPAGFRTPSVSRFDAQIDPCGNHISSAEGCDLSFVEADLAVTIDFG